MEIGWKDFIAWMSSIPLSLTMLAGLASSLVTCDGVVMGALGLTLVDRNGNAVTG